MDTISILESMINVYRCKPQLRYGCIYRYTIFKDVMVRSTESISLFIQSRLGRLGSENSEQESLADAKVTRDSSA